MSLQLHGYHAAGLANRGEDRWLELGAAFLTSGGQTCRASSFPPAKRPAWQPLAHGFGGYCRAPRGGPERRSASGARARKDLGLSRAADRARAGDARRRGRAALPVCSHRPPTSPRGRASPQHCTRSPRSIPWRGTRSPQSIPWRGTRSSRETLVPLPATSFTFHFGEGEDGAVAGAERGHPGRMLLHGEPVAGGSSPPPRAYILAPPERSPPRRRSPLRLPARRPLPQHRAAGAGAGPPARCRSGLLQTRRHRHGPPRPPPGLPGPPPGSRRGRRCRAPGRLGRRSRGAGPVMRLRTRRSRPAGAPGCPEPPAPLPAVPAAAGLIALCLVLSALSEGKGEFTLSEPIGYLLSISPPLFSFRSSHYSGSISSV